MSGGKYDYFYRRDLDHWEADDIASRLAELGHQDASNRVREIAEHLRKAQEIRVETEALLKAVEWIDSGDSLPGSEQEAVAKWREAREVRAAMRDSDEESEVDAEYRADHIGKALDERARRLPKTFLDPVAVADLVYWIATGEVRGYSAAEDEERARSVVDQIHRTGQWSYYAPRLLKGK